MPLFSSHPYRHPIKPAFNIGGGNFRENAIAEFGFQLDEGFLDYFVGTAFQLARFYAAKDWKVTAYIDGKRKQHWFASEREAKTFADDSNAELHAYGSQLSDLSPSDRADSQRALDILKGHPEVSLAELAKTYAAQAAARSASKPLDQFLAEYETFMLLPW